MYSDVKPTYLNLLTSVSGSPLTRKHLLKLTGRTLLETSLEASWQQVTSLHWNLAVDKRLHWRPTDCRSSQLTIDWPPASQRVHYQVWLSSQLTETSSGDCRLSQLTVYRVSWVKRVSDLTVEFDWLSFESTDCRQIIIIIIISGVAGFQRSWPASYKLYSKLI